MELVDDECLLASNDIQTITFDVKSQHWSSFEYEAQSYATPIYLRGLWFNGHNQFVKLKDLILNPKFTMNYWIRPSGAGNLFSINLT